MDSSSSSCRFDRNVSVFCIHKPNFNGVMLEHIIFVSRGVSNDTALTMRARTWGEILPCECGDFSPVPSNGLSLTCKNRNYLCA